MAERCTICGQHISGGDDQVLFLARPVDSFHMVQHLSCRLRAERSTEREACADLLVTLGRAQIDPIKTHVLNAAADALRNRQL